MKWSFKYLATLKSYPNSNGAVLKQEELHYILLLTQLLEKEKQRWYICMDLSLSKSTSQKPEAQNVGLHKYSTFNH